MNRHIILIESFVNEKCELLKKLEQSISSLEEKLKEGEAKREICTDEWCIATKYALDDIAQTLYSISDLSWVTEEDAQNISNLRHSISHLNAKYRDVLTESRPAPPVFLPAKTVWMMKEEGSVKSECLVNGEKGTP
ncbi:hypothetical protein [uncultured Desulfobulbus sp.]|uniref:hypothetical protein n=1 Tax=uncultured Desulfobulbus sp. TaxID=239745 RepID=UPI0029C61630|nr:hypothetical protein [uncultured Desulfobulbus sp.]